MDASKVKAFETTRLDYRTVKPEQHTTILLLPTPLKTTWDIAVGRGRLSDSFRLDTVVGARKGLVPVVGRIRNLDGTAVDADDALQQESARVQSFDHRYRHE